MQIFKRKMRPAGRLLAAAFALILLTAQFCAWPVAVKADGESIVLDICVYYNDQDCNWYVSEKGEQIEIFGEGTYTLTFDCAKDLSAEAQSAGVMSLTNIGAIYLVDDAYLSGDSPRSNVDSLDIFYESIKLDGKELTITQEEPVSAIKAAGQVDTNGPINAWDGCFIEDSAYSIAEGNVLNFEGVSMPKKIEITFTISNMYFKGSDVPATTGEAGGDDGEETSAPEETSGESSTQAATEASTAESAAAEASTAAASTQEGDDSGSIVPIIVTIVLVIVLIAVIAVVVLKMKKK